MNEPNKTVSISNHLDDFLDDVTREDARHIIEQLTKDFGFADVAEAHDLFNALTAMKTRFERDDVPERQVTRPSGLVGVDVFITYDEYHRILQILKLEE